MTGQLRQRPLWGGGHLLSLRGKTLTQRDIRKLSGQRDIYLHIIMGPYAPGRNPAA